MRRRYSPAALRDRHPLTLALCLSLCVSAVVLFVFYLAEPQSVRDALRRMVGKDASDKSEGITIPTRERPIKATTVSEVGERIGEVTPQSGWFSEDNQPFHSAILIAGSSGYANYRHQADACHAFQLLKHLGIPLDQIITFIFDDIAHHRDNPYPGQIFNRPGGQNVYPGCAKDYRGWDVNKATVFAVLRGDARAVRGVGSGRVIKKDPRQRIFFFYSDHGSAGTISMPVGPPIFADELQHVLKIMADKNTFREMVIYLEACNAGSMFRGFHMDKVYAATAADAYESSFATYCPDYGHKTRHIEPNATYVGACLGDLFSVSWMEDTEDHDVSMEKVESQVGRVTERTSNARTYYYGSHVKTYGDKRENIRQQVLGNYLSYFAAPSGWTRSDSERLFSKMKRPTTNHRDHSKREIHYDQRSADLLFYYQKALQMANDGDAVQQLEAEVTRRYQVDTLVRRVIQDQFDQNRLPMDASVEAYATQEVFFRENRPVVDDWDCLRGMLQVFEENCVKLDDYSRQYTCTFANFCNAGLSPVDIVPSLLAHCPFIHTSTNTVPVMR